VSRPAPHPSSAATLVTGGAGFIGSHLVAALLGRGASVTVLDDFSSGRSENLPDHDRLRVVRGDAADADAIADALEGCTRVVHLAAVASVQRSIVDPIATHRSNLLSTIQLLERCRVVGVDRVVYASSAAVYGNAQEPPVREFGGTAPETPYAIDKLAGEAYLGYYRSVHGVSAMSLRFFNVYGPRQPSDSPYSGVISLFMKNARGGQPVTVFGDGLQTRDFVYVEDLVAVILGCLDLDRVPSSPVLNVAGGTSTSVLDLIDTLERVTERKLERRFVPPRQGEVRHSRADLSSLRDALGKIPVTGLMTGLQKLYAHAER
jgi:UDP-glucose 4-epimerase